MVVHVNVLELVTAGSFTLVTCNCTLRYKQTTDIKPKLFTVLNIRDSKKALCPMQLPCFFFFNLVLNLVQVRAIHGQRLIVHFFFRFSATS